MTSDESLERLEMSNLKIIMPENVQKSNDQIGKKVKSLDVHFFLFGNRAKIDETLN